MIIRQACRKREAFLGVRFPRKPLIQIIEEEGVVRVMEMHLMDDQELCKIASCMHTTIRGTTKRLMRLELIRRRHLRLMCSC
jgi:hypothetical protein